MERRDKIGSYKMDYKWILLSSFFLFIYLLCFSLQGFDLTDEGYVLYSYQNIFEAPETVEYAFGTYLTSLVGGIWEQLFGSGGWYSFRILNSIIIVGGYVCVCYLLKEYWNYRWIIFASFLIVVMNMHVSHGTLVFHYYSFSGFTNTLIGVLAYKGFIKMNRGLVFFSSILLGMNVFVRIPNVTLCLIPYVLLILMFLYERNLQECRRYFIYTTTGLVTGVIIVVGILVVLRHDALLINQLYALENTAQDTSSSHSIGAMLKMSFVQYGYIAIYMAAFTILIVGIRQLIRSQNSIIIIRYVVPVVIFICVVFSYYGLPVVVRPMFPRMTFLLAITYCLMIYVLYKCHEDKRVVYLVSIFVLVSILQPLGSDWSIGNMGPYSVWGIIPVACCLFLSTSKKEKHHLGMLQVPLIISIIFVLLFSLGINVCKYCYRDEGSRFSKTYRIAASPLASVRTSMKRGQEIESLLNECKKYIKEGDIVFFACDVPGLYYLTKTRSLLSNPWPMVWESDRLRESLKCYSQKNKCVVIEHQPQAFNNSIQQHYLSNMAEVQKMLNEKNYSLVWSNGNYSIYK